MLVGHGTRDQQGTDEFFQLGNRLAERLKPAPVATALLEFQQPTIPQAWDELVRGGATHIHVAPLLLFAAGHAKDDIPKVVAECQRVTPGVTFDQSRPLSRHRAILELVTRRIVEAVQAESIEPREAALLMVGRGNRDPCAQADMRVLSELTQRRLSFSRLETAFYAMAPPSLESVLQLLGSSREISTVLVYPHLLFSGRLMESILTQVDQAAKEFPDVRFRTARYLGPDPLVAQAIAARLDRGR